jgi:small subunit ribosomal protein S16
MLTIRLTRKGKKNQPFFKVVLIDKRRSSKGGRAVEDLGYVDPVTKRKNLKKERILYWLSKGAQPSDTIHNYLVSEKIIDAKKINVSRLSKKAVAKIADVAVKAEAEKTAKAQKAAAAEEAAKAAAEKQAEPEAPVEEPKVEEKAPETPAA